MKMNKIAAAVLAVGLALPAFAQEQGSSSGKETPAQRAERDYSSWLPSAGEFSIGFGLDPLSTWVGQLFNGHNTGNALGKLHGDPNVDDSHEANLQTSVWETFVYLS